MELEAFLTRWTSREGGAERANYQGFLYDLCDVLDVARPEVSGADASRNNYAFERAVRPRETECAHAPKRIDLYKRNCFILEAKQSRLPGRKNALPGAEAQPTPVSDEPEALGRRSVARGWDVMMLNARRQAETYVFMLEADHAAPPFLIVCDVGHCFELYADFSGTGRAYSPFPDRTTFRVYLHDLHNEDVCARLRAIWEAPETLDPAKKAAMVTREIAGRLAAVSKALETEHPGQAEDIAHFLMRCIFTMFAASVGLLPKGSFVELLENCVASPGAFAPLIGELWSKMDEKNPEKRFFSAFRTHLRHFNGNLFHHAKAYRLRGGDIGELLAAARKDWREVDPAIFGALLEQALETQERKRLGAHYTPRAYVQRLVEVTVMEPLRADWQAALTRAESQKEAGEDGKAVQTVRVFLRKLCATRVLDPACGTGNFLYVALELMKTLEGEVLETLARLGEPEIMGLDRDTVDPHQFLGLELNPRAAAIAELVVWIGFLQQHYRTRTGHPGEPILRAFKNINFGSGKGYDAVLTWDGFPVPAVSVEDGKRIECYPNARRPEWPEAEFIVGNPPFISASDLRSELGDGYTRALRAAHPAVNDSADFVLFWWATAAAKLTGSTPHLVRFGLVTTNSISQVLLRRVIERALTAPTPVSIVFAIPDHPWTKVTRDAAAVRIAMSVVEAGRREGRLIEVASEAGLDTDAPILAFRTTFGRINSDLTVGADATTSQPLLAHSGIAHDGVKLHGAGFLISAAEAEHLGLGRREGLDAFVRPYRNGRELTYGSRDRFVLDFFGLRAEEVRDRFPEAYQHLVERVRYDLDADGEPRRDKKGRRTGREWNNRATYRDNWWIFGEPRKELRPALSGLSRVVATVDTARHRLFQFVSSEIVLDDKSVIIAIDDGAALAVLSSSTHLVWALRTGGRLGVGNDPVYTKTRTFDPFPFPEPAFALRTRLASAGEELDALRKRVQAEHPDITLTGLYNTLAKIKAGAALTSQEQDVKARGLVLILKELHEAIDLLTFEAYGWPRQLSDAQILDRLVALNAERAAEEKSGRVRWLRPAFQTPRFAEAVGRSGDLDLAANRPLAVVATASPAFPADRYEQPLAIEAALAAAGQPLSATELARGFRGAGGARGPRIAKVLETLARYGRVTPLPDGRYAARRAA